MKSDICSSCKMPAYFFGKMLECPNRADKQSDERCDSYVPLTEKDKEEEKGYPHEAD